VGALVVAVAVLSGALARRYVAMGLCVVLVAGWGWLEQRPASVMDRDEPPALVVNMFSVGDGSCYLLRSGERTLMFDCGSQAFWRIGERSIVPALKALHVRRVDTLILSHADLDHFVGVLDVVDGVAVGRVRVSPDVLRAAVAEPDSAAGFLVAELRARGLEPEPIERGWRAPFGEAQLEVLWPAAGYASELNNDNSLVLRVEAAGRAVLLNGDIQEEAITRLLQEPEALSADITDLAHHGSFVEPSPAWLVAVDPQLVLQSSGPKRRGRDVWKPVLASAGVRRLWTDERGMVQVQIDRDGAVSWSSHRGTDEGAGE